MWLGLAMMLLTFAGAQLTETIAIGTKFDCAESNLSVIFRPFGSQAVLTPAGVLTPDLPGSYVLSSKDKRIFLQAVDLEAWASDTIPLMADTFGVDSNLENSASSFQFWEVATSAGCEVTESARGLILEGSSSGLCGIQTRDPCAPGTAARGCGYSGGATSVNPFADRITTSLLNITAAGSGSLRLTSTNQSNWIELGFSAKLKAATLRTHAGIIHSTPLPAACNHTMSSDGSIVIANLSLTLTLKNFEVKVQCQQKHGEGGSAEGGSVSTAGSGNDEATPRATPNAHDIDWRTFAPDSGGDLGVSVLGLEGSVTVGGFEAKSVMGHGHMPALLTPIPNLSGGRSQYLGKAHSLALSAKGFLDPTQPPFNADPTGVRDSRAGLQAAIEYSRRNYLTLWLPSGEYTVTGTLVAKQTERLDAIDGRDSYWQQARYVPNRIVGSTKGKKPVIVLKADTFTDPTKPRPVLWYWMQNSKPGSMAPPYNGQSQPNANCNQIFQGVNIRIGAGNTGAIGIRARGAQMMVVQDVAIDLGMDGLVGLSGGSGSGGSHYGVTVIGGKYGVDYTTAQPGPVMTGFTLVNQSCSALVYAGLQTLTIVGLRIQALEKMVQPAIITGCSAITYTAPDWGGRFFSKGCALAQFVSPTAVQPCIPSNSGAISIIDSIIELGPWATSTEERLKEATKEPTSAGPLVYAGPGTIGNTTTIAIAAAASVYAVSLHTNAEKVVQFEGGAALDSVPSAAWTVVGEFAHGIKLSGLSTPSDSNGGIDAATGTFTSRVHVLLNGSKVNGTRLEVDIRGTRDAPDDAVATRHLYNGKTAAQLPSFESPGVVDAASHGAIGDGITDNSAALTAALAAAAAAAPPHTKAVFLGRGIFRVSHTVELPADVSLLGAGLHLTSLVPSSSGFAPHTQVLKTTAGSTVFSGISVSTWAHYDSVSAVEWGAGTGSVWMQIHVNRMDECGISGGTPLASMNATSTRATRRAVAGRLLDPIPECKPHVRISIPLVLVTGSGSFYNFYNEDAMGTMVAGDYQTKDYRHILVTGKNVRLYHFNPEHSVSNANSEFNSATNISVYGTKSEGHSATIWVRNCTNVFHSGHAGNAKPYSCDPTTCASWHPSPCACDWAGVDSLFRVENCMGNCRFGNLWSQSKKAPGFSEYWGSSGSGSDASSFMSPPMDSPVVVAVSDSLSCTKDGEGLKCKHNR
jgi:hypothetical protein